jgi:hypothetical protein
MIRTCKLEVVIASGWAGLSESVGSKRLTSEIFSSEEARTGPFPASQVVLKRSARHEARALTEEPILFLSEEDSA